MALVDLVMPKLGESIMEATILKWHKKAGDTIKQDETVLDIATDKVDSEVPSTAAGTLAEVLYSENDVVAIGTVIARIETEVGASAVTIPPNSVSIVETAAQAPKQAPIENDVPYIPQPVVATNGINKSRFYSPLVLTIAGTEGVSMTELETIPGTGNEGRVSKKDILAYVSAKKAGQTIVANNALPESNVPMAIEPAAKPILQTSTPSAPVVEKVYDGNVEIIEMDRMRKLIAKHMVDSKHTSPHVTSFAEADVTNMVLWREKVKRNFEKENGTKLTFTPMFIDCLVRVMRKYPMINSSLDGDKIIVKKDLNIGMATALPTGNLIVPVIKNADHFNMVGLSKSVNGLAEAARSNKLKPDDTVGGTFTLTNVGTFGSLMGTPIINQPQVAIMAVGAIKKRPMVLETPQGDVIAIRHMMYLSLSYDHRIVDGSLGASFLTAVAKEFEGWDLERGV